MASSTMLFDMMNQQCIHTIKKVWNPRKVKWKSTQINWLNIRHKVTKSWQIVTHKLSCLHNRMVEAVKTHT